MFRGPAGYQLCADSSCLVWDGWEHSLFSFFKEHPACNSSLRLILPDHPYTSCGGCYVSEVTELFYCVKIKTTERLPIKLNALNDFGRNTAVFSHCEHSGWTSVIKRWIICANDCDSHTFAWFWSQKGFKNPSAKLLFFGEIFSGIHDNYISARYKNGSADGWSFFFSRNVEMSRIEVKAEHLNGVFQWNRLIPGVHMTAAEILLNISGRCCGQRRNRHPSCFLGVGWKKDVCRE